MDTALKLTALVVFVVSVSFVLAGLTVSVLFVLPDAAAGPYSIVYGPLFVTVGILGCVLAVNISEANKL